MSSHELAKMPVSPVLCQRALLGAAFLGVLTLIWLGARHQFVGVPLTVTKT